MGSVCCVAAREKTIHSQTSSDIFHRNVRCSPSWSFRWENRGRVAGEETSVGWLSDGPTRNEGSDNKYESAYVSEEGSPLGNSQGHVWQKSISDEESPSENLQQHTWKKSQLSEGTTEHVRTSPSDHSSSKNVYMDSGSEQVKESTESIVASCSSPTKLSISLPSASSVSPSPLPSQSHLLPGSSTPSRWSRLSPGHRLLWQVSDSRILGLKSPNNLSISEERQVLPSWSNDSTRGSPGGSSDGWSMNAFSELMAASYRDRWSFDSESFGFIRDKITRSSSRISDSSAEVQTCRICSKLLTEKSLWSSQKIISTNELSVVAVLVCGHVYHAECLETVTPEINKYDPACPVCTFGEKQTRKLAEKVMKAETDMKARNKRLKNRVVDGDSILFDRFRGSPSEGKGPKLSASSSMKGSLGRPFLKRHFSFGSKGTRSLSENHSTRKRGFFWAKSSKE